MTPRRRTISGPLRDATRIALSCPPLADPARGCKS